MHKLFYSLFCFLLGCASCTVDKPTDSSANNILDDRPWEVWSECSQQLNDHPCNFSLQNQHGDTVELYDFYGKVIIVDLSAMWCGPCSSMAYAADPIVNEYGASKLEWLTIIIDNESGTSPDQNDVQRWAEIHGITGHVLMGDRTIIATDAELRTGYPVTGWPTFVVIDQEMILRHGVTGWSESVLRQLLDQLITEGE